MLTSYSRVTVVSGSRRVDIALPSSLPVAEVVPQVLRFCAPEEDSAEPGEFTLARVGGSPLSLSQTLAEAGVRDGDVIELRTFTEQSRAAFVEDVRDTIEDSVDGAGGAWTSRSTVTFAIVTTCGVVGLLLIPTVAALVTANLPGGAGLHAPSAQIASAFVCSAVLAAMTFAAAIWAARWSTYITTSTAAAWASLGGAQLADHADARPALILTVGLAFAVAVAGLLRMATPRAITVVAAAGVLLAAAALVLVADESGADGWVSVRLVVLIAVLIIGVMPRVSIAVGGLSSADYRVRNAARMTEASLAARFEESSGLLLGAVIGVAITVGVVGFSLGLWPQHHSAEVWDRILSVSLAVALLLRSRVFSRIQFMLPLRLAAVLILAGNLIRLGQDVDFVADWLVAVFALLGLAALAVSVVALSDITRARIKRLLNVVEFIVVVDLVVVTMGSVALYDYVRKG